MLPIDPHACKYNQRHQNHVSIIIIMKVMARFVNLATLLCEIWQPCLSECFKMATNQFLNPENIVISHQNDVSIMFIVKVMVKLVNLTTLLCKIWQPWLSKRLEIATISDLCKSANRAMRNLITLPR